MTAIVILFVLIANPALAGPTVTFPHSVNLDADHHLFVYGQELTGRLTFEFDDGRLLVNGITIEPRPGTNPVRLSDERLLKVYGRVPFVQQLIERSVPMQAAVDSFHSREQLMIDRITSTWRALRDSIRMTGPLTAAGEAIAYERIAESALSYLDEDVVGPLERARTGASITPGGTFQFSITGMGGLTEVWMGHSTPPARLEPESLTVEGAAAKVRLLLRYFSCDPTPGIAILARGGNVLACGQNAEKMLAEIRILQANPDAHVVLIPPSTVTDIRSMNRR